MPDGGTITLAATGYQGGVEMTISDTGHGITQELQSNIFQQFFTTKNQGTGIGLASAYSVITNHNGRIWFESTEGQGTTFYIQLPTMDSPSINSVEQISKSV